MNTAFLLPARKLAPEQPSQVRIAPVGIDLSASARFQDAHHDDDAINSGKVLKQR